MPEKGFWFLRVAYLKCEGGRRVPSIAPLATFSHCLDRVLRGDGSPEVRGTKMAGIKKRRVVEGTPGDGMSGVGWQGGASLHLPTNFMRLVNSRKKLTDRLIHGLSNFII